MLHLYHSDDDDDLVTYGFYRLFKPREELNAYPMSKYSEVLLSTCQLVLATALEIFIHCPNSGGDPQ